MEHVMHLVQRGEKVFVIFLVCAAVLLAIRLIFKPKSIFRGPRDEVISKGKDDWKGPLFGIPSLALILGINHVGALYREGYAVVLIGVVVLLAIIVILFNKSTISQLTNAGKTIVLVLWAVGPTCVVGSLFIPQEGDKLFVVGAFYVTLPPLMIHIVQQVQSRKNGGS